MQIQESGEMYLETVLILEKKGTPVRSVDVGDYMGFSKPSVSRAVGILKSGGLLDADENGALILTDEGRRIAEKIYERHTLLTGVLISLGVDAATASEDACKIEHDLSDVSFEAIKRSAAARNQ